MSQVRHKDSVTVPLVSARINVVKRVSFLVLTAEHLGGGKTGNVENHRSIPPSAPLKKRMQRS